MLYHEPLPTLSSFPNYLTHSLHNIMMTHPSTVTNVKSTPVRAKADGTDRFAYITRALEEKRKVYCAEMSGLIVGPVEVEGFVKAFTPLPDDLDIPPPPKASFHKVPREAVQPREALMYPGLVRATVAHVWLDN